jgi:hypothetical protein
MNPVHLVTAVRLDRISFPWWKLISARVRLSPNPVAGSRQTTHEPGPECRSRA